MAIIVSDANIFIDLEVANLTESMFRLEHEFVVPDILYYEELQAHHAELPGLGLKIERLAAPVIQQTVELKTRHAGIGTNDLIALALAKETLRPLLTGDGKLRLASQQEGVDVRGTLWLLEEMLVAGQVSIDTMAAAYQLMREGQRRLPWDEIAKQLRRLRRERHR